MSKTDEMIAQLQHHEIFQVHQDFGSPQAYRNYLNELYGLDKEDQGEPDHTKLSPEEKDLIAVLAGQPEEKQKGFETFQDFMNMMLDTINSEDEESEYELVDELAVEQYLISRDVTHISNCYLFDIRYSFKEDKVIYHVIDENGTIHDCDMDSLQALFNVPTNRPAPTPSNEVLEISRKWLEEN